MKPALILISILIAVNAHADFIGATLEAGMFAPDSKLILIDEGDSPTGVTSSMDGERGLYYGIAVEHPVPLIPNARIQGSEVISEGTITTTYDNVSVTDASAKLDLSHTDYTVYYEFLDGIFWLHLDAGLTLREYNGSVTINNDETSLSTIVPMFYLVHSINIPGTDFLLSTEVKTLSIGDNSITDSTFKVQWDSGFLLGVEAGIRRHEVELDDISNLDINSTNEGVFVGVFLDF